MATSSISLLLAAATIGIVIFSISYIVQCVRNSLNAVPGPIYARFTKLPLKAAVISGRRIHHVHALHQQYGPLVRIAPGEVAVADTKVYKQIHGANSGFHKSPWYKDMASIERDTVFLMDGKPHAARRRLLSRPFSKTHLRQHWEHIVRERIELAVSRIFEEGRKGAVDVMQWWTFLTSDVSTQLMFGQSFQTLEHGQVSDYIRKLQGALMGGGIGVELPLVRWIGRKLPIQICQDLWCVNDYLMDYAKLAVDNMKTAQGRANVFANMMDEAEKGERLDDMDVKTEAQALIVAGTDTTSVTLTYLVWAVLSRPNLQQRIEEEVKGLQEGYREADVEQLELLSATIEETLRLYGAAPGGLPRMVPPEGVRFGDTFIPGGTTVTTQAYTYHRDPSLFPEPLEFIPERWMASNADGRYRVTEAAKAVFTPFGSGPRTCLGVHLAYMELRLAAAEFFGKCAGARLAPSATPESMEMENFFLIAPVAHKCEILVS